MKDPKSAIDEATFDTTYFLDPLACSSCKKKFCHAIRLESDERFCKNCYAHRFGVEKMMKVSDGMNEYANLMWEIPFDELTKEQKAEIEFIIKQQK